MKIYGAGLAGLIAGCHFQDAEIFEAAEEHHISHKALLRFRTAAVGDSVGIPFRKVKVHKGIWYDGKFVQPNIQLANMYSQKVIGRLADRSIWNLESVERFIAPDDFIEQLIARCGKRIHWSSPVKEVTQGSEPVVSTLPLSIMAQLVGCSDTPSFSYAPISVSRYKIYESDVFQTVYFPDERIPIYRASMTGETLIIEMTDGEWPEQYNYIDRDPVNYAIEAFNIKGSFDQMDSVKQSFGKIAPIDDGWRKKFIFDLTTNYNIYSLGRFATWRNILLDDVLKDIAVVKKLMNVSAYDRSRSMA